MAIYTNNLTFFINNARINLRTITKNAFNVDIFTIQAISIYYIDFKLIIDYTCLHGIVKGFFISFIMTFVTLFCIFTGPLKRM